MVAWTAVVAWMALIFFLSSLEDPGIPSGFATPGHAGLYAVLGVLLFEALRPGRVPLRAVAWAILIASAYGASDEFHQAFVPGRTPELLDWAWDSLGAFAGAGVASLVRALAMARRR
jgi:VanZ family protein